MKKNLFTAGCLLMALVVKSQVPLPTYQWATDLGGPYGDDFGLSVAKDASGNVYSTGFFQYSMNAGAQSLNGQGSDDIYISKQDAAGNVLWADAIGSYNSDKAASIAVDAAGNVYVTGWFEGYVDFDPSSSGTYNLSSAGGTDAFVLKLDASGNFLWAADIGGSGGDNGRGLSLDAQGNVCNGKLQRHR